MNDQHPDMRRDSLLRRALVPKGYRPTKDADIEKMLDTIGEEPISEEKKQRMLRKINGQEPMFTARSVAAPVTATELTEQERDLVFLHRAQNKPLPPDLAAKIKAMEDRASKNSKPNEGATDG